MQLVQLFLNIFSQLSRVAFSFAGFCLDWLFHIKNTLFHFLRYHVNSLTFLVGNFLQRIANFNKFLVGLLDPELNFLVSFMFLFLNFLGEIIFDFLNFFFKLRIVVGSFEWELSDVRFEFIDFLKKKLSFFMVNGLDVGKLIVENGEVFFKVLLPKLFFAIDLMLNLLPAIIEELHFGSGRGEGRDGREVH